MERLTTSIERQAAAYGKSGVERLAAERDRLIKKLGDEQGMVERVTGGAGLAQVQSAYLPIGAQVVAGQKYGLPLESLQRQAALREMMVTDDYLLCEWPPPPPPLL